MQSFQIVRRFHHNKDARTTGNAGIATESPTLPNASSEELAQYFRLHFNDDLHFLKEIKRIQAK